MDGRPGCVYLPPGAPVHNNSEKTSFTGGRYGNEWLGKTRSVN